MAYHPPPLTGEGRKEPSDAAIRSFLSDLGRRKEFRSLVRRAGEGEGEETAAGGGRHYYGYGLPGGPGAKEARIPGLRLHGAQRFVAAFASPDTPYPRLLLNWQTGTGKTLGALAIAQEFVRQRRPEGAPPIAIYVVGFTKAILLAELLRRPEFGFVTAEEVARLEALRLRAQTGGESEARNHAALQGALRRRVTDRRQGGCYRFLGYQEFANRLLAIPPKGERAGLTKARLYGRSKKEAAGDFSALVAEKVAAGELAVDEALLADMRGGLLVADEIHNTYNVETKNNYGVAIQYALDRLAAEGPAAEARAVFMTATLTGGSALEVVDLLNFLIPPRALPQGRPLRREDFFAPAPAKAPGGAERQALRPGALERLGRLSAGRVSFHAHDPGAGGFPRRVFEGVPLRGPGGAEIPYLRFTPCPMAPYHARALARMLRLSSSSSSSSSPPGERRAAIPAGAHTLYDMAYPNPAYPPPGLSQRSRLAGHAKQAAGADEGLYSSAETPARLAAASPSWREAAGVLPGPPRGAPAAGPFLALDGPGGGVGLYSAKYQRLARDVLGILAGGPGKALVYHSRVRMSGVLQIQALLEANGLVDDETPPTAGTRCALCGRPRAAGCDGAGWAGPHDYAPARFLVVHSEVERPLLARRLEKFNALSNREGREFRALVGSRVIREGFDLKAVRHVLVASLPTDFPTLIQVIGRAVRVGSHAALPEEQREVRVRIYVSTAAAAAAGGPAPEVERYAEKAEAYLLVQEVEKALRRYAVDGFARPPAAASAAAALEGLPYRPLLSRAEVLGPAAPPPTTETFDAYGHGRREVGDLAAGIRALFETRPVWTYAELWGALRAGGVAGLAADPASFDEGSYALALRGLCGPGGAVARVADFYVRAGGPGVGGAEAPGFLDLRSSAAAGPALDIESYLWGASPPPPPVRVAVGAYVARRRAAGNFAARLAAFEERYGAGGEPIEGAFAAFDPAFHFTLLRALLADPPVAARAARPGTALARAAALYGRFKVLLTGRDLRAAPPAARALLREAPGPAARPRAYVAADSVQVYGGEERGWYGLPRAALVADQRRENDVVVGYVEKRGGRLRFKLRPPLQQLKGAPGAPPPDARSLPRGAVCETRPRSELEGLARLLGCAPPEGRTGAGTPRLSLVRRTSLEDWPGGPGHAKQAAGGAKKTGRGVPDKVSAPRLCGAIYGALLSREEEARAAGGARWFYLFNDPLPLVAAL